MIAKEYKHDPDRLRAFLRANRLTAASAGELIGVDSRTMRRWTGAHGAPGSAKMPYSAWYALHHIVTGDAATSQ